MNQVESAWKLVIKLDIGALEIRFQQLQDYMNQMTEECDALIGNTHQTCMNILRIIRKGSTKLTTLLTHLRTLYKTPTSKRGLIDAIGTISKTLFGTMDADDERVINEQLDLLRNKQHTLQHAMKNQLKVLKGTIGHMDSLEKTLTYNDNLLVNVTERMKSQLAKFSRQEDIDERLLVLTTILTDLVDDTENTMDFLTLTGDGIIMTRLLPIETIVVELREAAAQLTQGLHFPFKVQLENWHTIQKYIKINAYYDRPDIYTILKFPIIAYPTYKIINTVSLPVHDNKNIFTFVKVNHPLLAIDKENHHYMLPNRDELKTCVRDVTTYTCDQNLPIYYAEAEAPCEVQIYMNAPGQMRNCEKGQVLTENTLWITLTEEQSWLYSTPNPQEIAIRCENRIEDKITLKKTGKLSVNKKCTVITPHVTLRTEKAIKVKEIQAYIPTFNLTLEYKSDYKITSEKKTAEKIKLKQVITDPLELTKLSLSVEEINNSIDNQENSIIKSKYFVYPVSSGTLIVIIAIIIGAIIWKKGAKRQKVEAERETQRRQDDAMMY